MSFIENPTKLVPATDGQATVHPDEKTLEWFEQGRLEGRAALKVANHLLDGCRACSEILGKERSGGLQPVATPPSAPLLDWVSHLVRQPPGRIALILENSRVPPPVLIAEALEELASDNVAIDLNQQPRALLGLAVDTLLGAGIHHGSLPQNLQDQHLEIQPRVPPGAKIQKSTRASTSAHEAAPVHLEASAVGILVRIGSRLCQELLRNGEFDEALQILKRVTAASTIGDLSGLNRAALLTITATVLKANEQDAASHASLSRQVDNPSSGLLATSRYDALVEAQQLYARGSDQFHHSQCALRLAELLLSHAPKPPIEAIDLDDLIRNLELHAERLAAHGLDDLALIAQRYLATAYQRAGRSAAALAACEAAAETYGLLGQQEARLTLVLESARILRKANRIPHAFHRYQEARRGLVMTGQPLLAAIASVEATEMQLEQSRKPQASIRERVNANVDLRNDQKMGCLDTGGLAAELSTVFASGEFDRPIMAALLLLRESCLEGTMTLDQVQHCHSLLCASLP